MIFLSGASAADDYIFFLKSDENLKLVGDNYDVVKKELDTMLKEYKKLSKVNNFWKIENLEEVDVYEKINLDEYKFSCRYCGRPYNGRGYTTAMRVVNRVEDENNPLNSYCSYNCANLCIIYNCFLGPEADVITSWKTGTKVEKKFVNRIIQKNIRMSTLEAKWEDIVKHHGGYAQLNQKGISKNDQKNYNVDVYFEKVELIGEEECLAHIKIKGEEDALKIHNIPKSTFKYKGNYNLKYDDGYTLLVGENQASINFIFEEKSFLPDTHTRFTKSLENIYPDNSKYSNTLKTMFDDLVPNSFAIIVRNDSSYNSFRDKYDKAFGPNQLYIDSNSGKSKKEIESKYYYYLAEKSSKERQKVEREKRKREKQDKIIEKVFVFFWRLFFPKSI